jgi:hypothetical protein
MNVQELLSFGQDADPCDDKIQDNPPVSGNVGVFRAVEPSVSATTEIYHVSSVEKAN